MNTRHLLTLVTVLITFAIMAPSIAAQTTAFTYQGSLANAGVPANGNYDLEFALFDAVSSGAQVGSTITQNNVTITNGSFAVTLDFGDQFPGEGRFLEIRIRPTGQPAFTTLAPRNQIRSAPYSVKSANAENAATAANATQLGGVAANQYVLTGDVRLSDARDPLPGSSNYIQNTTSFQESGNFNIGGTGRVEGTLNVGGASSRINLNRLESQGGSNSNQIAFNTAGSPDFAMGTLPSDPGNFGVHNYGTNTSALTILKSNGNVGIGTTSPNAKLDVIGGAAPALSSFSDSNIAIYGKSPSGTAGQFDGRLHVYRDGNPTADLQSSQFRIIGQTNPNRQFYFGFDTTAAVGVIQAADTLVGKQLSLNPIGGNVGIGTVDPNSHLHIKANAPAGFAVQMENTSTMKRLYIGNYGISGGGNHWPGLDSANTSFLYAENPLAFTTPAGIFFSGSTNAEHMRIGTNGNVGIGVGIDTPYKFQVLSRTPNAFAAHVNTEGLGPSTSYGLVISAGTDAFDSALQVRDQSGNPLMRVRGNGYVGVGTTNALNRFHVVDSISSGFAARIQNTANSSNGLQISAGDSANSYPLWVEDKNSSSMLLGVRANGTVQIGPGVADLNGRLSVNGKTLIAGNLEVTGTVAVHTDGPTGTGSQAFLCIASETDELTRCPSSIRFKKNVEDFRAGLSLIDRLRPVTFDWIGDEVHDLGLVAEEVAVAEPLLATYEKDGRVHGVKYERIGVVLINAVKEQQALIELQKQTIEALTRSICRIDPRAEVCAVAVKEESK